MLHCICYTSTPPQLRPNPQERRCGPTVPDRARVFSLRISGILNTWDSNDHDIQYNGNLFSITLCCMKVSTFFASGECAVNAYGIMRACKC